MLRSVLSGLGLGLAVAAMIGPGAASAQSAARILRVGYIVVASPEEQAHLTKAFEDGMRDLGYVEGRDVAYERRFAHGDAGRLPELAAELVKLAPDVIVTGANPVISAVMRATTTIPVVMGISRDPVGAGFVASYGRPGGNVTGLASDPMPDVLGKDLEVFKEILPRARRVALLWNPVPPGADTYRKVAQNAARRLGVAMQVVEVRERNDLEAAFEAMVQERADGVWVLPDPLTFTARRQVVALSMKHRLPSVYWQREYVDSGGLVSYGSSVATAFRRAAWYVDRILKGAKPEDLAVEQAAKFELVVNLGTAKSLGLEIPQSLMLRADEVIP
ncbi:MAG: ABC transporter substrate-binding protein [Betaproteobacteria bacterium]|nr:ABC transporter substrate-binding protein [Betaproteobacteria bacterium]